MFQGFGEKEESEGALRQLGHSGGRVEGPEEEEEEVKYTISIFNASLKSSAPRRRDGSSPDVENSLDEVEIYGTFVLLQILF